MIRKSGHRFSEKIMLHQRREHDPEKPAPDLVRGGHWFSEKIILQRELVPSRHAADAPPGFERQPETSIEPEAIDRSRRMNGADTGQTNARPLERAFLQHAPRRRIGDPGARLQRLVP